MSGTRARRTATVLATALLVAGCAREAAPDVRYTLLDGSSHQSAELRGRVVLVNFWATSCTTTATWATSSKGSSSGGPPSGFTQKLVGDLIR